MYDNSSSTKYLIINLVVGLALVWGVFSLYNMITSKETYISENYGSSAIVYENVVTEQTNDYFVKPEDSDTLFYVVVDSNNKSHTESVVSEDDEVLYTMHQTSSSTDTTANQGSSSNLWILPWLLLR